MSEGQRQGGPQVTARHRYGRNDRVHTIVHHSDSLFELLIGGGVDMNGRINGYSVWVREHNRAYPDEAAAEAAGLRAIDRLAAGGLPEPAYRQAVLPLPWEHLWFLGA